MQYGLKVTITIEPTHPVDQDDVSDLLEALTDSLDAAGMEPDIGTHYAGSGLVTIDLELLIEATDALVAQTLGSEALVEALRAASVEPTNFVGAPASMQAATTRLLASA